MHFLDFFSIIERDLSILNPSSHDKLMLLAEYCKLRDGVKVLDIGSGKGYMVRQWAKEWAMTATCLELNKTFIAQGKTAAEKEGVAKSVTFIEGPALEFKAEPRNYDVVTCIGAPFAIGSFEEALVWMLGALKPEGYLALGDVFLSAPIPDEVVKQEDLRPQDYQTLPSILQAFEKHGLSLTAMIGASQDDWDRYVSGGWTAAFHWARENPKHPDRAEVLRLNAQGRLNHLSWMRQYAGWGIFVGSRLA